MYFNRARYYSPKLGRFISRDPIGIKDNVNLYSYVGNNPLIYTDRIGTEKAIIFVWEDIGWESTLIEAYYYQRRKLIESGIKESNIIPVFDTSTIDQMNEVLQQNKWNIRDVIMVTHSSSKFLWRYRDINKNDIRKENISKLKSINENWEWRDVKMTIIWCNSWYWDESIAQDISNELWVNVNAPDFFININTPPNENLGFWAKILWNIWYFFESLAKDKWENSMFLWIWKFKNFTPNK